MNRKRRVTVFVVLLVFSSLAAASPNAPTNAISPWNRSLQNATRNSTSGLNLASRAFAMLHTCIYDAWAAYDERATSIQLGSALRRYPAERTIANREKAISYAAFRALADLFPADTESTLKPLMRQIGYDPNKNSTDIETPEGIGNVTCSAVLEFRHHDNANQLGDLLPTGKQGEGQQASKTGSYAEWTGYTPVNAPGTLPARATFTKPLNPAHWQPLTYNDASGNLVVQMFSTAHWGQVTPFALAKGDELRPALDPLPAKYGSAEYQQQAEELVALSANLTDRQKMLAEYWVSGFVLTNPDSKKGSESEPPAVRWMQFAEFVANRDHLSLDDQVKLFFVLSNAMMDADIAAYDAKRTYDSVRPATAIPLLFRGKKICAWKATPSSTSVSSPADHREPITQDATATRHSPLTTCTEIDGGNWLPYQPSTSPTPPSPEYVSEISAESSAAAEILRLFTGSDKFGYSVTVEKGSSKIEPVTTPAEPVVLKWETFTDAANDAGMATRYAGIHFASGDLAGRKLGRLAAARAWAKAQSLLNPLPE